MNEGKISVIMGIYNCAKTLPEAIDSIIAQTYENWELIMCDDCSTDDTYKVAEEYAERLPAKIILVKNNENRRLAYSLNHCLQYATGEYVARMDGDDISASERFEKQIGFLEQHPEVDLVGTAMQRFNDDGLADVVNVMENPDYYTLRNSTPFWHATILVRKKVYDNLDGYIVDKITNRAEDRDLWFRFYHAGFRGSNLPKVLYFVREDIAAIKRRTLKTRWASFKVTRRGFRLLKYPRWWIVMPFFQTIFKGIMPSRAYEIYRKYQKTHYMNAIGK